MRVVAFIEEEKVIRKVLEHLKLREDSDLRPPSAVSEHLGHANLHP
jgi:hypothetical protein